jgi:hypothetical protein
MINRMVDDVFLNVFSSMAIFVNCINQQMKPHWNLPCFRVCARELQFCELASLQIVIHVETGI